MSRNFELLRRAGKEEALFGRSGGDPKPDEPGRRPLVVSEPSEQEAVKFVQRVFAFPNSHAPRTVVFCSVEGNGSSEICCGAGKALAAQGLGSVGLVDANLRAPSLHQLLGVSKFPGSRTQRPGQVRSKTLVFESPVGTFGFCRPVCFPRMHRDYLRRIDYEHRWTS